LKRYNKSFKKYHCVELIYNNYVYLLLQEVFKSDFHSVAMLSRVTGMCAVLSVKDYIKCTVQVIYCIYTHWICSIGYIQHTIPWRWKELWEAHFNTILYLMCI